jgi:phosphatidylglycerophosphatase A
MTRLAVLICTFGYIGFFPVAPGTIGSAAGLAIFVLLRWAGAGGAVEATLIVLLFAAGVWSGTRAERHFGVTDPAPGVIDEVVGMLITLFLLPASLALMVVGFFVFRALDVVKPFPARRLEDVHGGLGMMADDAMAAVYSHLILRVLIWIAPAWLR